MAITTLCSGCGVSLVAADADVSRRARCPNCGQIYYVPGNSQSPGGAEWGRIGPPQTEQVPLGEDKYWLRASDQTIYGPCDRATLEKWISEGRVGINYELRVGPNGFWLSVGEFGIHPSRTSGGLANSQQFSTATTLLPAPSVPRNTTRRFSKKDRADLVMVLGILSLGIATIGIAAIIIGIGSIREMRLGLVQRNRLTMLMFGMLLATTAILSRIILLVLYPSITGFMGF
jgi:hypothetical protein